MNTIDWTIMLQVLKPASIGIVAQKYLDSTHTVYVKGTTSQGTFLLTDHHRTVFLTGESHLGPLNLQIHPIPSITDSEGIVHENNLRFPHSKLIIDLTEPIIWKAPQVKPLINFDQTLSKIREGTKLMKSSPFIPFLKNRLINSGIHLNSLSHKASLINKSFLSSSDATSSLVDVLGLGTGLTPSFDDFISGLLLVSSTIFGNQNRLSMKINKSNLMIEAFLRTNSVSASLLEAAAQGQADSRIVEMLAQLVSPEITNISEKIFNAAFSWGRSSGEDVFAGIAAGLTLLREFGVDRIEGVDHA